MKSANWYDGLVFFKAGVGFPLISLEVDYHISADSNVKAHSPPTQQIWSGQKLKSTPACMRTRAQLIVVDGAG